MPSSPPIGLIPAAGYARRLGPTPVSKEVFPVGVEADHTGESRIRVAVDSLLHAFRTADVEVAYAVLREGKWDVPTYLGSGAAYDLSLAYLVTPPTAGVPFTIDRATPFVRDAPILFGFPDVLFKPHDAFVRLLRRLDESSAAIVLGLFQARESSKVDMVDVDANGSVQSLDIKPTQTALTHTWMLAAWTPEFTSFLHEMVQQWEARDETREIHLGQVVNAATDAGLRVEAVMFDEGTYADIGTPEALQSALGQANGGEGPVTSTRAD